MGKYDAILDKVLAQPEEPQSDPLAPETQTAVALPDTGASLQASAELKGKLLDATLSSPSEAARKRKLASTLQIPEAVLPAIPEAEQQAFLRENDPDKLFSDAPKTADWLTRQKDLALVKDSLKNFTMFEQATIHARPLPESVRTPKDLAKLPKTLGESASNALMRGIYQMIGLGAGLNAWAVDSADYIGAVPILGLQARAIRGVMGDDAPERLARIASDVNRTAAERYPSNLPSVTSWTGLEDAPQFMLEGLLENGLTMIGTLGSGAVGKKLAEVVSRPVLDRMVREQAAKELAKREAAGMAAGAGTASIGMETSSIYVDVFDETGELRPGVALAFGSAAGAIDAYPAVRALKTMFSKPVAGEVVQTVVQRYGVEGLKAMYREGGTEYFQTWIENGAISYVDGRELFNKENLIESIDAFIKGAGVGGVMQVGAQATNDMLTNVSERISTSSAEQAATRAQERALQKWNTLIAESDKAAGRAERTAREVENLQALSRIAAETPARTQVPDVFKNFVETMVEENQTLTDVYVPQVAFTNAIQQSGITMESLQELAPTLAAQLEESRITLADIRIPLGEYMATIAGTPVEQLIVNELKTSEDGPTYGQAREFYQSAQQEFLEQADKALTEVEPVMTRAEFAERKLQLQETPQDAITPAEQIIVEAQSYDEYLRNHANRDEVKRTERNEVEAAIFDQFKQAGRFTAPVNRAYTAPLVNFYETQAERLGTTASELYKRFPFKVQTLMDGFGRIMEQQSRVASLDSFRPENVKDILRKEGWTILTAENPNSEQLTSEENAARMADLFADLTSRGLEHQRVEGFYDRPENSVLVTGISQEDAVALGRKYGQESVLTREGLVYKDGSITPTTGEVNVFDTAPENYYSTIQFPDGAVSRFSVELDFDTRIQPGEVRPIPEEAVGATETDTVYQDGKPGQVSVRGVHFSNAQRPVLSGGYFGTGIRGAEAERVARSRDPRIKKRLYFYVDEGKGVFPEGGVGRFRHEVQLDNLYDGARNPLKLPTRDTEGERDMNVFEAAVIDAGFDGYYIENAFGRQGAVVMLGDATNAVQVEQPETVFQSAQAQTPAFRRWFGDSKVVDEKGQPKVVYHGTVSDFATFDRKKAGKTTTARNAQLGFFFSDSPAIASVYTKLAGGAGANLMPVHLAIENPLELTATSLTEADRLILEGLKPEHDGAIVSITTPYGGQQTVYLARNPEQIKSAIGNVGAFDPASENIMFQPAYHGSPYKFDQFSLEHIGSGEGAQAYGWGLYFAERKDVAEHYRQALIPPTSISEFKFSSVRIVSKGAYLDYIPRDRSAQSMAKAMLTEDILINERDVIARFETEGLDGVKDELSKIADELIDSAREEQPELVAHLTVFKKRIQEELVFKVDRDEGQLYEVDIPDDGTYLRWDQPIAEQKEVFNAIQEAVYDKNQRGDLGLDFLDDTITVLLDDVEQDPTLTGEDFYDKLRYAFDPTDYAGEQASRAASVYLNSLGVTGIRYLDGWSRTGGEEETFNYVLFDDSAVRILNTVYQNAPAPRASFNLDTLTTTLLSGADLSSVIHESGHFYLEMLERLTLDPNAPQEMQADFDKTLNWFGVTREQWGAFDLEQRRPYHEQWAQSFERWNLEGRAPTAELQTVFSKFRAWLLSVYKSVEEFLIRNPEAGKLNDEIREVFGRLLASQEAIERSEQARAYTPLFDDAKQAGVSERDFDAYLRLGEEATETAVNDMQARSLRDMKWLSNARSKAIRELQALAKVTRRNTRAEVEAEVRNEPVYAAQAFLRNGEAVDPETGEQIKVTEGSKLNTRAVAEMYPEGSLDRPDLTKLRGMTSKDGLDPDLVARMFGFRSGDHLIREIAAAENITEKIDGITDQRMLENHGELVDERSIERAADEAVHNNARARFMATGLKMLTKSPISSRELVKAASAAAEQAIALKRVRDIKPRQYIAAETRANKEALKLAPTDPRAAARQQQAALASNRMAASAMQAQRDVEKGIRYLSKFNNDGTRKNLDIDYLEQIDAILQPFDLRVGLSLRTIDSRTSLTEWIAQQEAMGFEPVVDPELVAQASQKHYKNMTMEEFRGLIDTVKQIEHLGRLKKKLLTAQDNRDFAERVGEAVLSIEQNRLGTVPEKETSSDVVGRLGAWWRHMVASHRKFASFMRQLDGDKNLGVMYNLLVRPMLEAGNMETESRSQAADRMAQLFQPIISKMNADGVPGNIYARKRTVPGTDISMTYEQRVMFGMNWGNDGNRQRLLDGGVPGKRAISIGEAEAILGTLDKTDWDFIQSVWDFIGEYKTQIAEQERRLTGVNPAWIEPAEVKTAFGTYRGGYFPAKYDTLLSTRSDSLEAVNDLRSAMQGAFGKATARNSYAKERARQVVNRPLLLSFNVIARHVNEVTHRLAWQDWLIDANRVVSALDTPLRESLGAEGVQEIRATIRDIAAGEAPSHGAMDVFLTRIRTGASIVGMGWKVFTALLQPSGITQTWARIGGLNTLKGVAKAISHPVESNDWINENSLLMKNRAKTLNREINEILNVVRAGEKVSAVNASMFILIAKMQRLIDVPTYLGAYELALMEQGYENAGSEAARKKIEKAAHAFAEQTVIDTQVGGEIKDLAGVQRGNNAMKLFTNFYSWFSTLYQLNVENFKTKRLTNPAEFADFVATFMLINVMPAVYTVILREFLKEECGWDDVECMLQKYKTEQLGMFMGQTLFTREFAAGVDVATGGEAFGYSGPAAVRLFSDFYKAGQQVSQGEVDMPAFKAVNNVAGTLLHYPAGQINATVEGMLAIENGEVEGTDAVKALLVGPPR